MTPAVEVLCSPHQKKKEMLCLSAESDAVLSPLHFWKGTTTTTRLLGDNLQKIAINTSHKQFFFCVLSLPCICSIRVCWAPTSPSRCSAVWWPMPRWGNLTPATPLWPDSWWPPSPSSAWMPVSVPTSKTWLTPLGKGQLQGEVCVFVPGSGGSVCMCVHVSGREREREGLWLFERFLF